MRRTTKPLAFALLLLCASSAFARQDADMTRYVPPPPSATSTGGRPLPPPPDFSKSRGVLRVRGSEVKTRDAAVPGDAALIGIAPAEMPASLGLRGRSKKAEPVDPVELRRRTLALYGDRADSGSTSRGKSSRSGAMGHLSGGGGALPWLLGGSAVAAVVGWQFLKRRKRPVTD